MKSLTLDIRYRQRWINLAVADGRLTVVVSEWGEGTVRVGLDGEVIELNPGEPRQLTL